MKPKICQYRSISTEPNVLDIKHGKVWIQQNMTEAGLAKDLVDMGIPKEDIILGLYPSYKPPYTGYGIAE